jgi:hypothetical protein
MRCGSPSFIPAEMINPLASANLADLARHYQDVFSIVLVYD